MYNEYDEMMDERDLDQDIDSRKALIEEAKELDMNTDWNTLTRQINDLKRRWKKIYYWESALEDQLEEEFEAVFDSFYARRNEGFKNAEAAKQELVNKAKALANSKDWNKTTEEMNELMNQWKAAGRAGKETDDTLWEAFQAARQKFFDNKRKHFDEIRAKFGNAKAAKEAIIKTASELAETEEWNKATDQFKELMEQWKAAGNAGRNDDDALWNQFNDCRQKFYARREEHYAQLHKVQAERLEKKAALVEKAKEMVAAATYTKENTEAIKALNGEWKAIGSAGKEKEDKIWNEFRTVVDGYFTALKQHNEDKHAQWVARMNDARARKNDLVLNQKRQLKRLQDSLVGLISDREVAEAEEKIAEKKAFIAQVEAEIADIDKSLAK